MRKLLALSLCMSSLGYALGARADTAACTNASSQGQILRDAHKLVEARNQFLICARQVCPSVVRKDCTTWLEQAQATVPTIVPIATDDAGNSLPGVKVLIDGNVLVEKNDGRAVEVNPGTYTFTFVAPDGTKVDRQVVVAEGEKDKRVVAAVVKPVAAPGPQAAAPPPITVNVTTPSPATSGPPPAESAPQPEASHSPWRTVGIVTAGVGVVGVVLGSVFGVEASSKKGSANCNSNSVCPNGTDLSTLQSAQSAGNLSTVFFIAGGVLAAGGIMTWALAPSGSVRVAPSVGAGGGGVTMRGMW
jgi:hypothetical protein